MGSIGVLDFWCVFYSLSVASLASIALAATSARSDSSAACSAGACVCAFFRRKWLMKSFKPSRSIANWGIPEILVNEKKKKTNVDFSNLRFMSGSKKNNNRFLAFCCTKLTKNPTIFNPGTNVFRSFLYYMLKKIKIKNRPSKYSGQIFRIGVF